VFAWREITRLEDGKFWFTALRETDLEPPWDLPPRRFAYVDPLSEWLFAVVGGRNDTNP